MEVKSRLINLCGTHEAKVAVVGLGYVGLPLALEFADAGFKVFGIDNDPSKIETLKSGKSYISDVSDERLTKALGREKFFPTTDFGVLSKIDAVSICVPTPLSKTKDPDVSYIANVTQELRKYLHPGTLIVLESTTYPGTTREIVLPALDGNLKVGRDFFLAFSPERVDPSNQVYNTKNTPKLIGGITNNCLEVAQSLYGEILDCVVPVSSTETAEMAKLLENTFRAVNIALVNEIAIMSSKLGLNSWEVIEAAATKPFGFMKFLPGPGIGGHCIPIDPLYLSWKLKTLNYTARFIDLASEINSEMPHHVVGLITKALNSHKKCVNGSRITVLGVAYKAGVSDVRESPALDIIQVLREMGGIVHYHDPYVPSMRFGEETIYSTQLPEALSECDIVVILTSHPEFHPQSVFESGTLIVDTRNFLGGLTEARESSKVFRL